MTQPTPNRDPDRDSDRSPNELQRTQLMDSLLDALYGSTKQHSQDLVTQGLTHLERNSSPKPDDVRGRIAPHPENNPSSKRGMLAFASFVVSAALLIVLFSPIFGQNNSVQAAIERTIQNSLQDIGRHYKLKTQYNGGQLTTREADLFVKGPDRFAVRVMGPFKRGTTWIGAVEQKAWALFPIGPIFESTPEFISSWLSRNKEIQTPFLHISTILRRMKGDYNLLGRPDSDIETKQGLVRCQHIIAERKEGISDHDIPLRIELWIDSETGVAMKVRANWNPDLDPRGRESIEVKFLNETELTDDFFTPEAHGGQNRKKIRLNNESTSDVNSISL